MRLAGSAEQLIGRVVKRIQSSTYLPVWHASVFRIFLGMFILVIYTPNYGWLSSVPPSLYNPPLLSMARLFSGFPPAIVLQVLDLLIVLLAVCIAVGIRTRISCLAYIVIELFMSSFRYSFGKIDHTGILLLTTLFCFSFSNWGTKNAIAPDRSLSFHPYASGMVAVLLSFAMFTAGFEKLLKWIDFDLSTSGFLFWFYHGYFNLGRQYLFADAVFDLPIWLLELMDYTAVIFELSPFLCLLAGARFWKLWLLVACTFHLANVFLLNIIFTSHLAVYCSFFLYPLIIKKNGKRFLRTLRFFYVVAVLMGAIHIVLRLSGNGVESLLMPPNEVARLWIDVILWIAAIVLGIFSLLAKRQKPGLIT
jgi:hypothetical protein